MALGMEGTFGIRKDDRREKVTNQRERAMKETNMGQRKEEKGRKEHKGKERGKEDSHSNEYRRNKRYPNTSGTLGFRKSRA